MGPASEDGSLLDAEAPMIAGSAPHHLTWLGLWIPLSVLAAGCIVHHTGQLVTSVQVLTSSVPVEPGSYALGPWVSADGCDYLDTDFSVTDLIYQAQGGYDALVQVTIEQVQRMRYTTTTTGVLLEVFPGNAYCYRVRGRAVRLLEAPPQLGDSPGGSTD